MKHIKLFENWEEDYKKDLAFHNDEHSHGDEENSYAYRYRQLVRDRDIESSLMKIKEMHSKGQLNKALDSKTMSMSGTLGLEPEDRLFIIALEKGREDVAEFLRDRGYKIKNLESVQRFLSKGGDKPEHGINREEITYNARRYV
jgi:hypothetical protein